MKTITSFVCFAFFLLLTRTGVTAEIAIRFRASDDQQVADRVELAGVSSHISGSEELAADAWADVFQVFTVVNGKLAPTPLLGEYQVEKSLVIFRPRYPFQPGLTYRAIFEPKSEKGLTAASLERLEQEYSAERPERGKATTVEAIFPSSEVLPENLLKFYLHFSAPMSRAEAYQRIRLLTEDGKQIEFPFLELAEELWSPDGRRFTLYFDPGRIKRGLKPREEFGPALLEGGKYTLVIDQKWPDANGEPLAGEVQKKFRIVGPDDQQPDPKAWTIAPPGSGGRNALTVDFEEPLDSAMLERVLSVQDADGHRIEGTIAVSENERRWRFQPSNPWKSGKYQLVVAKSLEDLAGNSIGRAFEVDVFRPMPRPSASDNYVLTFFVKPRVREVGAK